MAGSKGEYIINVHYPNSESGLFELRRRLGNAYIEFIQNYIKTLPIDDEDKNKIYISVIEKLLHMDKLECKDLGKLKA